MDEYMTTEEVAAVCRTPQETLRYWRHIGWGPASFKLGRRVLYDAGELRAWIEDERSRQGVGGTEAPERAPRRTARVSQSQTPPVSGGSDAA